MVFTQTNRKGQGKDFILSSGQESYQEAVAMFLMWQKLTFYGSFERHQIKNLSEAASQSFVKYVTYIICRVS